jgi:hypothetical protein
MDVKDVIDYLNKAADKTYSECDKYFLRNAVETLYNMKDLKMLN